MLNNNLVTARSGGRITLPKDLRDELDIGPNTVFRVMRDTERGRILLIRLHDDPNQ